METDSQLLPAHCNPPVAPGQRAADSANRGKSTKHPENREGLRETGQGIPGHMGIASKNLLQKLSNFKNGRELILSEYLYTNNHSASRCHFPYIYWNGTK
jgi:hypothetical protein